MPNIRKRFSGIFGSIEHENILIIKFVKYRKTEFYSLNWNMEGTQLISANFGGPIGELTNHQLFGQTIWLSFFHLKRLHVT